MCITAVRHNTGILDQQPYLEFSVLQQESQIIDEQSSVHKNSHQICNWILCIKISNIFCVFMKCGSVAEAKDFFL
jgi:hypothetical protein